MRAMAAEAQSPIVSSCKSAPQTPVANMVEGCINTLMREKAHLVNKLADAKLEYKHLARALNGVREEFKAKFEDLEDTIERLEEENETFDSINVCIVFR